MVARGDTFEKLHSKDAHLNIVISDPAKHDRKVLLVNFSTLQPGCDDSCVVGRNEHRWLRHDSVVVFLVQSTTRRAIELGLSLGELKASDPLSADLLRRVTEKFAESRFVPFDLKKMMADQGLITPPKATWI